MNYDVMNLEDSRETVRFIDMTSPGSYSSELCKANVQPWLRQTAQSGAWAEQQIPATFDTDPWMLFRYSVGSFSRRLRWGALDQSNLWLWSGQVPSCCQVPCLPWWEPFWWKMSWFLTFSFGLISKIFVYSLKAESKVNTPCQVRLGSGEGTNSSQNSCL